LTASKPCTVCTVLSVRCWRWMVLISQRSRWRKFWEIVSREVWRPGRVQWQKISVAKCVLHVAEQRFETFDFESYSYLSRKCARLCGNDVKAETRLGWKIEIDFGNDWSWQWKLLKVVGISYRRVDKLQLRRLAWLEATRFSGGD
jgi:hypothetical protein